MRTSVDPPPWLVAPTGERNPDTVDIDLASTSWLTAVARSAER